MPTLAVVSRRPAVVSRKWSKRGIQGQRLYLGLAIVCASLASRTLFTVSFAFQKQWKSPKQQRSKIWMVAPKFCANHSRTRNSSIMSSSHDSQKFGRETSHPVIETPLHMGVKDRRGAMAQVLQLMLLTSGVLSTSNDALALGTGQTTDETVAIIGGNGRTGMAVAETLAKDGVRAVTLTRSGKDPYTVVKLPESTKTYLSHYDGQVDVRDIDALNKAVTDIKATTLVFAASASRMGGNSFDVDEKGVANAAQVAKRNKCKLIVISALAVDRPDSQSFKMTNSLGSYVDKIMDAKLLGEQKAKDILKDANKQPGDYVIIRPGVLLSGKSRNGAADIELNQGDTIGGGISRDELAGVVLGAIQSNARGVTVEAYRKATRTKLQPEFDTTSGNELISDSYAGLFEKAKLDA